jgi:hypothetical protein
MAGWTGTDVLLSRSSGVEASAGSVTVPNLEEGTLYDFVVFSRNRHMDAWEGHGSAVLSARPLRPPSVVLNLRVVEINATCVRLAFTPPQEAVSLSGYRVSSMQAPDAPVSATPHENQTVVAYVETTSTGFEDVFALVAGLGAGKLYYLAVQAVNPGGGGDGARITVRPFGATGGPEGVQVMIASSKAILLTWRPPLHLPLPGLRVSGYEVMAVLPPGSVWGEAGSTVEAVGSTSVTSASAGTGISHALANSTLDALASSSLQASVLTYAVRALVEQDLAFGGGIVRGSASVASISVGRMPRWRGETPADGSVIMAWIGQTVAVPLQVADPDIATGQGIRFELLGAAPPESGLGIVSGPEAGSAAGVTAGVAAGVTARGILQEGLVQYSIMNATASSQLIFKGTTEVL